MFFQMPLIMFYLGMKAQQETLATKYINAFKPPQPTTPCKSNLTS